VISAEAALAHWKLEEATLRPVTSGLINQTFSVESHGRTVAVFQRLNTEIFSPLVHEDIEAITNRLEASGVPTPRLIRTSNGDLWHEDEEGGVWRALSFLGDRTIEGLDNPQDAHTAGELIAQFHVSLNDFDWQFRSIRPGAHDTDGHLRHLETVIPAHPQHRLLEDVRRLGAIITNGWSSWKRTPELPQRIIHGDLKISNIRFLGHQALCLVDLDTMAHGTLDVELGDAMRSWCNPSSENSENTVFNLSMFQAAMTGYANGVANAPPSRTEWESIVGGTERICWELAARFAADALTESYFGFDPRYGGRGEHNLLRARGQARLAQSVRHQRHEAEDFMERLYPGS